MGDGLADARVLCLISRGFMVVAGSTRFVQGSSRRAGETFTIVIVVVVVDVTLAADAVFLI